MSTAQHKQRRLCVIGSLNVDLTVSIPRFHQPGETVFGTAFATYPGGKGGNQAVAAARLGADVLLCGRLGDDPHGRLYRQSLAGEGIDTAGVVTDPVAATGVALIEVDAAGENRIAVVPGANMAVDRAQIDALMPQLLARDIFLLQLELDLDVTAYVARALRTAGKTVLLDPGPAPGGPLPEGLLAAADYLLPNRHELAALSGMPTDTAAQVQAAARALLAQGPRAILAKRGARGCLYVTADDVQAIPPFPVATVDTTAAGDSFAGGFAAALAWGAQPADAAYFASAVAALSTTGQGAQGAMPSLAQVRAFLGVV